MSVCLSDLLICSTYWISSVGDLVRFGVTTLYPLQASLLTNYESVAVVFLIYSSFFFISIVHIV